MSMEQMGQNNQKSAAERAAEEAAADAAFKKMMQEINPDVLKTPYAEGVDEGDINEFIQDTKEQCENPDGDSDVIKKRIVLIDKKIGELRTLKTSNNEPAERNFLQASIVELTSIRDRARERIEELV